MSWSTSQLVQILATVIVGGLIGLIRTGPAFALNATSYADSALVIVRFPTPPHAQPLSEQSAHPRRTRAARELFRAIADPTRLRLIGLLASSPRGESCVRDLVEPLGLSQPTVSHHLKPLFEAELVACEKRGPWVYFRLIPAHVQVLRDAHGAPTIGQPVG